MSDETQPISAEAAERMLAGQPPIRLEVTLAEADLLVLHLSNAPGMCAALLAEKLRQQALPQAQEICLAAALLHSLAASDVAN